MTAAMPAVAVPVRYRRGDLTIDTMQFDGTRKSAEAIDAWLRDRTRRDIVGQYEHDDEIATLTLHLDKGIVTIPSGIVVVLNIADHHVWAANADQLAQRWTAQ